LEVKGAGLIGAYTLSPYEESIGQLMLYGGSSGWGLLPVFLIFQKCNFMLGYNQYLYRVILRDITAGIKRA
jgi:hypothetical protein